MIEFKYFFSGGNYLYLPTANNPKVVLAVDDKNIALNSFKLYNPFSIKSKAFKEIIKLLLLNVGVVTQKVMSCKVQNKSEFLQYLETKLNTNLVSSVYISTAKDTVVLQLQSDNQIVGYLKYPLNKTGVKHLLNEKKAIEILSQNKIVEPYLLFDKYRGRQYLLIKKLVGKIKTVRKEDLKILLNKFRSKRIYTLKKHPRIIKIQRQLKNKNLSKLSNLLDSIVSSSWKSYYEVYEHGDFTPWNIVQSCNGCIPFDFEYFEEKGLEHMDIIKYYYQTGKLLNKYSFKNLLDFICSNAEISKNKLLIQIFLIKEILILNKEYKSYQFEIKFLEYLSNKKFEPLN